MLAKSRFSTLIQHVCRPSVVLSPQTSEAAILANTSGSSRFQEFLSGLGQLLRLSDCLPDMVYLGGLERAGSDGEYTYFYQDDTTQG